MLREGKGGDVDGDFRPAHVGEELCSGFGERRRDIPHGDGMASRRAEPAGGDVANGIAVGIGQRRPGAHRLATFGFQADALLRRAFFEDGAQGVGADEHPGGAKLLRDRPHECRARRVGFGRKVLAVKAEPGLQPQAVAGGEADPLHAVVAQQLSRQFARVAFRQADLEAVLAGVAGAAHEPVFARLDAVHEGERARLDAGGVERGLGFRPLDRQEDTVERFDPGVEVLRKRLQMGFVGDGVAGIGDDHEAGIAEPRDDEVVEDAGLLIEEEGELGLRRFQRARIDGAGFWQIYFRIMLPMALPIFVVAMILQVTGIWNDFLFGVVFTRPDSYPMTVQLNNIVNSVQGVKECNVNMAATLLTGAVPLIVYFVSGRLFVRGIAAGAVKG